MDGSVTYLVAAVAVLAVAVFVIIVRARRRAATRPGGAVPGGDRKSVV